MGGVLRSAATRGVKMTLRRVKRDVYALGVSRLEDSPRRASPVGKPDQRSLSRERERCEYRRLEDAVRTEDDARAADV